MMRWSQLLPSTRLGRLERGPDQVARTPFQRDHDRIVFSTAFRRMHDKTQVFPMPENDHVHSRLTHSLEVSCVGRSLGTLVGEVLAERGSLAPGLGARDVGDVVAAACLAHDIGNPPFGHSGEDAIASWFQGEGLRCLEGLDPREAEDFTRFEGNAQGFRILTRLEIPASVGGLQLTHATLAVFSKYPREAGLDRAVARRRDSTKKHGFFRSEAALMEEVAAQVGLPPLALDGADGAPLRAWCRHPLVYLVEAADDLCYRILDIEDGHRLGYVGFREVRELLLPIVAKDPRARVEVLEDEGEHLAYLRAKAINQVIGEVREAFFGHEAAMLAGAHPTALVALIPSAAELEAIRALTKEKCYDARGVLEIELAGYDVMASLLSTFTDAFLPVSGRRAAGWVEKVRRLLPGVSTDPADRYATLQRITDHVAGMTDSFAVTLYRRLRGIALPTGGR
jgi:dGTPase